MPALVIPFPAHLAAHPSERAIRQSAADTRDDDDAIWAPLRARRQDEVLFLAAEGLDNDSAGLAQHILEHDLMHFADREGPKPLTWNETHEL
ncbi:MAG: hypothetical protein CSA72_07220 [Rhodobacterales bacterium]|nr:MAG: hypothetical protein CSA72_07220 [Rhodobacterales bacterium]